MYFMDSYQRTLANYVGKIFILAKRDKFDLIEFIDLFMHSETCAILDTGDTVYGGKGYMYLYEEICEQFQCSKVKTVPETYTDSILEWIGYIYRYWNYSTGLSSPEISNICSAARMFELWFYGHTLSPDMFIEDVISGVI